MLVLYDRSVGIVRRGADPERIVTQLTAGSFGGGQLTTPPTSETLMGKVCKAVHDP